MSIVWDEKLWNAIRRSYVDLSAISATDRLVWRISRDYPTDSTVAPAMKADEKQTESRQSSKNDYHKDAAFLQLQQQSRIV